MASVSARESCLVDVKCVNDSGIADTLDNFRAGVYRTPPMLQTLPEITAELRALSMTASDNIPPEACTNQCERLLEVLGGFTPKFLALTGIPGEAPLRDAARMAFETVDLLEYQHPIPHGHLVYANMRRTIVDTCQYFGVYLKQAVETTVETR